MRYYTLYRKRKKKSTILISITAINTITGWSKITQYYDKYGITIVNLVVTTYLNKYPWKMEITSDQVSQSIFHEFRKYLIGEEFGIKAKPNSSSNPTYNTILG